MSRPKIAIMLPKLSHYGGVEGFAWRLAQALGQTCEVHFICARQETESPDGVRVIKVGRPVVGKGLKVLWFALAAEWIRRRGKYDLSIGLGNTVCQDILRVGGGPTSIFWKHSIKAYPKGPARKWKMIRRRISVANNLVLAIENMQMRFSGQIIANSHLVKDWLVEAFPQLKNREVTVIYNQPDLTRFNSCTPGQKKHARQQLHIPENTKVIATAGTNFMLKGIRSLILTLDHLPENTMLLVAGARRSAKYIRLARQLGVAQRVRFMGKVDNMVTLYQASDAFILLSFYDACSNAVLEALASGLPVISTTTNGSSFFLPSEWTVDPEISPSQLAMKINQLFDHDTSRVFTFPPLISAGLDPYVAMVKASLTLKNSR